MVMSLYSGTPGSGKSLHSAQRIYWHLKRGYDVIANFSIDTSKIPKCKGKFNLVYNNELTPQMLKEYSIEYFKTHKFGEDKILLFIDESQRLFNSRNWNAKGRDEWITFFSEHRHYGYYIVLVAQFDRMLDRQIRSLLEYEFVHRKVSNFGGKGKLLSVLSFGQLFVSVEMWYPLRERVSSTFFKAHKKYYSLYDSYVKDFDK